VSYADHLEGEVVGFTYRATDGSFAVARVVSREGENTAVGAIGHLHEGQRLVAEGQWVVDARFGRQFKVERFLVEDPRTLRGLEKYLASALPGVGEELAHRMVAHFGLDTLLVLQKQPERLGEVPGIGPKTAERIAASWEQDASGRELLIMLRGFDVAPAVCRRVMERFGKDALAIVTRTPYRLTEVRGIGFRTADAIARRNGVAREDPERLAAAVTFLLEAAEDDGSCFLPEGVLVERLHGLDVDLDTAAAAVDRLAGFGKVTRLGATLEADRPVYRPAMAHMEAAVARLVRGRVGGAPAAMDLSDAESAVRLELSEGQRAAVRLALGHGVSVITGGPGTGKTTLIRVLAAAARLRGETWLCAAPTGRAARRLTEAAGQEAKTLHRLLEFSMQEMDFRRNSSNPLEADAVLVDEASMVDIRLMEALLTALPQKARLVLVGDHDQLPSVGPGKVLADLLRSGVVPVARLTEVYRQAEDSGIVRNAWKINRGEPPVSAEREPGRRDFFLLDREDAVDAQQLLLQVVAERMPANGFDPRRDVQVLTPMHAGPLGTVALNDLLQARLNPTGPELRTGKRTWRLGDRVLQTRNDYENDVFNGDVGTIVEVTPAALAVDFDGRLVTVGVDTVDNLELAYAISIHKSQGSEYPAVIIALHHSHFVMLRRNLLYTAVTRARRFACVVGSRRAVTTAVGRVGGDERWTGLAERLES
jgi:exodeoxyribonuclease V alpha subunit